MSWKTQNGRRPDLETLEVNAPTGYIGGIVYPVEFRREKTGTIYYDTVRADVSAQTGRNAEGAVITDTAISSANTTYSCDIKLARRSIVKEEIDNMGGIEKADVIGGKLAKRAVMAAVEAAQCAALFTGTAHAVAEGGFFDAFADGVRAAKKVAGQTALVCGWDAYRYIMALDEVQTRLTFTGLSLAERASVLSLKPELLVDMLQQVFGVERVLIGDDDIWSAGNYAGKAAVVKLPDTQEMSYKLAPELGKTFVYQIDNGQPFEIETAVDEVNQKNLYTATSYNKVIEFNSTGKYILSGLKEDESSTSGSGSGN